MDLAAILTDAAAALSTVTGQNAACFAVVYSLACLLILWRVPRTFCRSMQALTVVGIALGPLGFVAALCASRLFRPAPKREAANGPVVARVPRRKAELSIARILDQRVYHPDAQAMGSLFTVLRYGTLADRQAAVEAVVGSFEPRLSPIVARALTDREQTIRALGASASAQVIQTLANTRRDFETEITRTGSADARRSLALLLVEHGRYNVLLSEQQRECMEKEGTEMLRLLQAEATADCAVAQPKSKASFSVSDNKRLFPQSEGSGTDHDHTLANVVEIRAGIGAPV